jgi:tetratricopeptide (TPR) repeat protein
MASPEPEDALNAAQWEEIEEASDLLEEQRYHEALIALRDVLRRSPQNPYAFFFLGQALWELNQLDPARDAYRAAVRLAPDYLGARVALAHTLRRLGDLQGAVNQAKEALRRFPRDGDAMFALGLAHAARGQRFLARKHLEGFLGTQPEVEAQLEVKQILEMLGIGNEGDPFELGDD